MTIVSIVMVALYITCFVASALSILEAVLVSPVTHASTNSEPPELFTASLVHRTFQQALTEPKILLGELYYHIMYLRHYNLQTRAQLPRLLAVNRGIIKQMFQLRLNSVLVTPCLVSNSFPQTASSVAFSSPLLTRLGACNTAAAACSHSRTTNRCTTVCFPP